MDWIGWESRFLQGLDAQINFQLGDYLHHIQMLRHCTHDELVAHIRRQSAAFSRGKSKYRGVSGQEKRWEARIGQYEGKKVSGDETTRETPFGPPWKKRKSPSLSLSFASTC